MQIYRNYLVLLLLSAVVTGCGASEKSESAGIAVQSDTLQSEETNSSHMISINGICYQDAGRTVYSQPDHTDGTIHSVTDSSEKPEQNEEANFPCEGASYCVLADGAVGVMTDPEAGTYELFLADDTVEFQGIYKKRKKLSDDTLKWLNFYYSLSESDRNALSMIPSEFDGQVASGSPAAVETSASESSYLDALTQEELDATEALAQYYFTEEVTSFEGVDQIYPAESSDPQYHNSGIEADYGPGNLIIYRVLTNLDRRDGNPFRYISIARKSKSDDWKIINSGF